MKKHITSASLKTLRPTERAYEVSDTDLTGFLVRVEPTGRQTYYFRYRNAGGGSTRVVLGRADTLSPTEARAEARKMAGEVYKGGDPQAAKKAKRAAAQEAKEKTFGAYLENNYLPWVSQRQRGHKETARLLTGEFSFLADQPLHEISPGALARWQTQMLAKGLAPATVNRRLAVLKAALQHAVSVELLDFNPLARMKPQKLDRAPKPRFLSPEEEGRLREALQHRQDLHRQERDRYIEWQRARGIPPLPPITEFYTDHMMPIVLLAMNTGLRRNELFQLEWKDVDLERRQITVQGAKAKSRQTRAVPLNQEATSVLKQWKSQCDARYSLVFPSPATGKAFDNVNTAWEKLRKDAAVKEFRFHDLRHHFASSLVMRSVDLNTVRDLLGHAEITTTLRYAHLAPEHRAVAVALLDKPSRSTTP